MERVTIKKIAEVANVSRGTVDKVLNNRAGVSDETRIRIKKIAEELGYKPNLVGKALAYQNNPLSIGVILTSKTNPFYNDIKYGIEKAYKEFKDFGLRVEYEMMESLNVEEQLRLINLFKNKGVVGLAIPPLDSPIIRDEINSMIEEGIQVITFNSDIKDTKRLCFIGQDLYKSGRVAADLMAKLLRKKGKVAIVTGSYNILAHNQRIDGFKEVINSLYPDIEIVKIVEDKDVDDIAYKKTVELINSIKELRAIFIAAAGVVGVAKAVMDLGKKDDIRIVCFDVVPETVKFLKEDVIDFTIDQDPFSQGYLPIKVFFEYFLKNKLPNVDHIKTKLDIKTKENIDL